MTIQPDLIGHYAGSLRSRLKFQDSHEQFLLLADMHALTDNAHDIGKVRGHVIEVALDYLAVGIDPGRSSICLQSQPPRGGLGDATVKRRLEDILQALIAPIRTRRADWRTIATTSLT